MITLLRNFFLSHWERKVISAILSVVLWVLVNHSLTTHRLVENVLVRIVNIPPGMTVEGLQSNGVLSKRIPLALSGNKTYLEEITANDLEVVLDATDKSGEWIASISRKNLVSLNPDLDLHKAITRLSPYRLPVQLTKLVTEKIPIIVAYPIGEAPRDYQFLDVWPYQLSLTVSGPEAVVKQLKTKGLNLTFNLNNISRTELDELQGNTKMDEVSFPVPDDWKQISIPSLSDRPMEIDDPQAAQLKIDFVRCELHPLGKNLPVSLFYPPEHSQVINPETYGAAQGEIIQHLHGLNLIRKNLYAKGVSRLFAEVVHDMLEIAVILAPKSERHYLDWSVQFINSRLLEDRYVSILTSDSMEGSYDPITAKKREEYLRNRFRNYMNRFQLYKSHDAPFDLKIELRDHIVQLEEAQ